MIGEILASLPLLFAAAIGLVILVVGLALLLDQRKWMRSAKKTSGTVVGARTEPGSKGQIFYYPVYEFTDLQGNVVHRTQHMSGSSSPNSVQIGRRVPVYLNPDKPDEVRDGTKIQLIVGMILLLTGGGVFCFALLRMHFTLALVIALPIAIALVAFNMRKSLRDKPLTPGQFRVMADERRAKKEAAWEAKPMLGEKELKEAQAQQDKTTGLIAPIFLVIGIVLIVCGAKQGETISLLMSKGVQASGTVVRLVESHSSDGTTYKPVVHYRSREGEEREFTSSLASSPAMYDVGERVGVLYLESKPHKEIIDHGILNWGLTGILYLAGVLTILFSAKAWSASRRRQERL